MFRKILFWSHFSIGTLLGIVIAWLAATGFLLSYETQITDWAERRIVVNSAPVESAQPASSEQIVQEFQKKFPTISPTGLLRKKDATAPVTIEAEREIYQFHPTSGAYLGQGATGTRDFFHTVTMLHRWLALKGDAKNAAQTLVGITALSFSFLLVTGLILWIPKKLTKKAFRAVSVPNLKAKGRARNWNLHLVSGLWFAPLIAITSFSGSIIAFPWMKQAYVGLFGETVPQKSNKGKGGKPGGDNSREKSIAPAVDASLVDAAFALTHAQRPEWNSHRVEFPKAPSSTLKITSSTGGRGQAYLATDFEISQPSLTVESEKNQFSAQPKARQLLSIARWIHTGELGGIVGQSLAALTALIAILLTYTGFALGLKRIQNQFKKQKDSA